MTAGMFAFEADYAGDLRFLPMAIRHGLDRAGIKLGLEDWRRLPLPLRRGLLETAAAEGAPPARFREALLRAAAESGIPAPPERVPLQASAWAAGAGLPPETRAAMEASGSAWISARIPGLASAWPGLPELSRYALWKLSLSRREPDGLARALREFLSEP